MVLDHIRIEGCDGSVEAGEEALEVADATVLEGKAGQECCLLAKRGRFDQRSRFLHVRQGTLGLPVPDLDVRDLHQEAEPEVRCHLQAGALIRKTVRGFVEAVGARTSTPGGGSVSALVGALGAALGAMVGWLTYGRRKFQHLDATVRTALPALVDVQEALLRAVDADTDAYRDFMAALRLPKDTDEQRAARRSAMQEGLKTATRVPLAAMETADRAWDPMLELARVGQFSSRSDLEVGAKALEACLYGAHQNVLINLQDIEDEAFRAELEGRARSLLERGRSKLEEVQRIVAARTGDIPAK